MSRLPKYWILPDLPKGMFWRLNLDRRYDDGEYVLVINIYRGPRWLGMFNPWKNNGQVEIDPDWNDGQFFDAVIGKCMEMVKELDYEMIYNWLILNHGEVLSPRYRGLLHRFLIEERKEGWTPADLNWVMRARGIGWAHISAGVE